MARKLCWMSWEEVQKEMSIAGSPDKIRKISESIMSLIVQKVDTKNHAELTNIMFGLDRIKAELKLTQKWLEDRTFTKLKDQKPQP